MTHQNRKPSSRRPETSRGGFTLMEILAAVAIIGVLTAVLLSNLGSLQNKSRISYMVETLTTLRQALTEHNRQVGVYPANLILLYRKPTTGDKDICGGNFTTETIAKWRGPYIGREITDAGIVIETDTITTGLKRKPASSAFVGQVADIQIFVNNVPNTVADELDDDLDGDGLLTAGRIQWNTSPGYPRLIFTAPITGC